MTCDRCHHHAPTTPCGQQALLALCDHCQLTPPCGQGQHTWHGTRQDGTWACLQCGAALGSVLINTTPVPAPPPVVDDNW